MLSLWGALRESGRSAGKGEVHDEEETDPVQRRAAGPAPVPAARPGSRGQQGALVRQLCELVLPGGGHPRVHHAHQFRSGQAAPQRLRQ